LFSFQGTTLPDGASVKCAMDGLAFDRLLAATSYPVKTAYLCYHSLFLCVNIFFYASFNLFWLFPAAA